MGVISKLVLVKAVALEQGVTTKDTLIGGEATKCGIECRYPEWLDIYFFFLKI